MRACCRCLAPWRAGFAFGGARSLLLLSRLGALEPRAAPGPHIFTPAFTSRLGALTATRRPRRALQRFSQVRRGARHNVGYANPLGRVGGLPPERLRHRTRPAREWRNFAEQHIMLNACIYPSSPAPFPREAHFRFLMLLLVLPSALGRLEDCAPPGAHFILCLCVGVAWLTGFEFVVGVASRAR